MPAIPAFDIGVWNAWWFMCVYPSQWLAVILAGPKLSQRTGSAGDTEQTSSQRKNGIVVTVIWIIATLYSIFLPFYLRTVWFYTGLAFFLIGLVIVILATLNFFLTPDNGPVTGGIYRYSRHPMYLSMYFVYTGVSLAAASWLFFLITIATFFLQRQTMILEEDYCLKKYGDAYREYTDMTPRWIGIPKAETK
jgi:protein-S-isoprenylcysteine O-methyltransferase Ste14